MQRITFSLADSLAVEMDRSFRARGYLNRSEGVRDLVREALERDQVETAVRPVSVACLSFIFNHRVRTLATRLSEMQHAHHDIITSTTLVHLDHDHSLESIMLRGPTKEVRAFADMIRAERGVRNDMLNIVGVEPGDHHHGANDHSHDGHQHLTPSHS